MSDLDGLITIRSAHSVSKTMDRLASLVVSRGLIVFARIDHAANAASVDLDLRPTELLIFGHPKGGTPLMQASQTAGIDLPVSALAWQDAGGMVWLTVNDARWVARRHGLGPAVASAVEAIAAGMATVTNEAAAAQT